jgi:phosphatidylglycerophosphate synthase
MQMVQFDPDYFLKHQRSDQFLAKLFPEAGVLLKERAMSWFQTLYLSRMCQYIAPGLLHDVAIIKPGLPFLPASLQSNGIRTISFDDQVNLLLGLEERTNVSYGDISERTLENQSVGVSVTHNILQKMSSEDDAIELILESLRIANDFSYHQITDKGNIHFPHDDLHQLGLSLDEWKELFEYAITIQDEDWKVRDVHLVKSFDVISWGRPPVYILERGEHNEKQNDLSLPLSTRMAQVFENETSLANLVSLLRPVIGAYAVSHLIENPVLLSLTIASAIGLDAVDGKVARMFEGRDTFVSSKLGGYMDIFADRALEIETMIAYAMNGMISPIIPAIFTLKGVVVDTNRIIRDVRRNDFSDPLGPGSNANRLERGFYGGVKVLYLAGVPILPEVAKVGLGAVTTAVGVKRGICSLLNK